MKLKPQILTIIVVSLVLANVFFVVEFYEKDKITAAVSEPQILNTSQAYILPVSETSYLPILDSNFERPVVAAKSALVFNVKSGKYLYQKNIKDKLPIASLTKLLTAAVILENFDLDQTVTITGEVLKIDGEKQTLYKGEKITVENLLKMIIIESSNDAAEALSLFALGEGLNLIDLMNQRAEALGMLNSLFLDSAGLNDEAYSTAEDMAKLVKYTMQFPLIWNFSVEKDAVINSYDGAIQHSIKNTNQLLGVLPDIVGGKTGYTDGALGCMILVVDIPEGNDKIISIIIGSSDRFGDAERIINWTKSAYRWEL